MKLDSAINSLQSKNEQKTNRQTDQPTVERECVYTMNVKHLAYILKNSLHSHYYMIYQQLYTFLYKYKEIGWYFQSLIR